jgi:hypothetical protein
MSHATYFRRQADICLRLSLIASTSSRSKRTRREADGEVLAISIPRPEAAVARYFKSGTLLKSS